MYTGIFLDRMTVVNFIPLFKTGNKQSFSKYRPMALVSQFSKVIEKLLVQKLDSFIENIKLLSESQHGFRSNRYVALALTEIVEEITTEWKS